MNTIQLYTNSRINGTNVNKFATKAELKQHLGTAVKTIVVTNWDYNDGIIFRARIGTDTSQPTYYNYAIVETTEGREYCCLVGNQRYAGGRVYELELIVDAWHTLDGINTVGGLFKSSIECTRAPDPTELLASYDSPKPAPVDYCVEGVNSAENNGWLCPTSTTDRPSGYPHNIDYYTVHIFTDGKELEDGGTPISGLRVATYLEPGTDGYSYYITTGLYCYSIPCVWEGDPIGQIYWNGQLQNTVYLANMITRLRPHIQNIVVDPINRYGLVLADLSGNRIFVPSDQYKTQAYQITSGTSNVYYLLGTAKLTDKGQARTNAGNLLLPVKFQQAKRFRGSPILPIAVSPIEQIVLEVCGQKRIFSGELGLATACTAEYTHTIKPNGIYYKYSVLYTIAGMRRNDESVTEWQISLPWIVGQDAAYFKNNRNGYEQSVSLPQAAIEQQQKWQQVEQTTGLLLNGARLTAGDATALNGTVGNVTGLLRGMDSANFQKQQIARNFELTIDNLRGQSPIIHTAANVTDVDQNSPYRMYSRRFDVIHSDVIGKYHDNYGYAQFGRSVDISTANTEGFWEWQNLVTYVDEGKVNDPLYRTLINEMEQGYRIIV